MKIYNKERLEEILKAQHLERNPRDQQIFCPKCEFSMWIHKKFGKLCRFCGFSQTKILDTLTKKEIREMAS